MLIGPKYKICKRLGSNVFEKCQTKSFSQAAQRAENSKKGKRAGSDFNRQLLEKQKLRLIYSLTEKQFSAYVFEALESGENPSQYLFSKLESRLDAVAYRTGLVTSRRAARQLATHGHLIVNGMRMNVPSYQVKPGDVITVREGSRTGPLFQGHEERLKEHRTAPWLTFDPETLTATMTQAPQWGAQDSIVDFGAVFEYYTR
jgi:small subunit ribosomal protein S4